MDCMKRSGQHAVRNTSYYRQISEYFLKEIGKEFSLFFKSEFASTKSFLETVKKIGKKMNINFP